MTFGTTLVETLNRRWDWAEEKQLNPNDLKNKLLLSKDSAGYNAWHDVGKKGTLETLEVLWSWAKEAELNTGELLLSQTTDEFTAFQLEAENKHVETLKRMWDWTEETQLNPNELKNKFLLTRDKYGYTAWHRAADLGSLEALETL